MLECWTKLNNTGKLGNRIPDNTGGHWNIGQHRITLQSWVWNTRMPDNTGTLDNTEYIGTLEYWTALDNTGTLG
ncbi:hypothetical protein Glove_57g36 [Diversispora epigaea]|uniref:Uncharacterized protein n=1 Tax=Diversispora epigaea TaxID=1348612 RepID=A0A397JCF7_9GLOM|nr:hypothetical protein Glove_57g36 [Diversispora epigaea]